MRLVKNDVTLIFNSTLEGSQLVFWCDESPNETMTASCLSDGRWSIDINNYSCTTLSKPCMHMCTYMLTFLGLCYQILFTELTNASREFIINLVIAMVSSIILFTTIFFVFGCVFGQLWQKRNNQQRHLLHFLRMPRVNKLNMLHQQLATLSSLLSKTWR